MIKRLSVLTLLISGVLFVACGSDNAKTTPQIPASKPNTTPSKTTTSTVDTKNPAYKKGLSLIAASDCLTCHKVDSKMIGPSYKEIADKYDSTAENIKMLAGKIIKGGAGVWSEVAMTPHAGMSTEDAEAMVKYIFLLKTKKES